MKLLVTATTLLLTTITPALSFALPAAQVAQAIPIPLTSPALGPNVPTVPAVQNQAAAVQKSNGTVTAVCGGLNSKFAPSMMR